MSVHPEGNSVTRSVSSALASVWDAVHIGHKHTQHTQHPPCELATEVLSRVKLEMGDAFTTIEEQFCDPACLQRYLRARNMDVGKATAMLKHTLEWRREFGVDKLCLSDFDDFLGEGWIYLLGNDADGRSVMMLRKRTTRLEEDRFDNFLGFLVLILESSTRLMKDGQETWTWLLDMRSYDSRNSPRFDFTVKVLQIVANHYPERLSKVFIVDAPTLFWVLYKALCPFLDPVTKSKVEFVYSKDIDAARAAARAPAGDAASGSGAAGPGDAAVAAMVAAAPNAATARFMPLCDLWARPYDRAAHDRLLASLGWPQ